MKEAVVQKWVRDELAKEWGDHMVYLKYPAGQYSSRGIADLTFCIEGLYISVEVKTETGKPTKLQERYGKSVETAMGYFTFIYGKDDRVITEINDYVDNHAVRDA